MSKCLIVGPKMLAELCRRYDGLGPPITNDEREILLFALYEESKARGGLVAEAYVAQKSSGERPDKTRHARVMAVSPK